MDTYGIGTLVASKHENEILTSIIAKEGTEYLNNNSLSNIISTKDFFSSKKYFISSWTGFNTNKDNNNNIKYYFSNSLARKNNLNSNIGWINEQIVTKNKEYIKQHKVLLPIIYGTGDIVLGRPIIASAPSICSQSYIFAGYGENINLTLTECENIAKYLETKFARYIVTIRKKTQNAPRDVYQLVPLLDFTENSEIDWSQSIQEIDQQLFKRYNLSQELIDVIDKRIRYRGANDIDIESEVVDEDDE